jgi:hypothetical protein
MWHSRRRWLSIRDYPRYSQKGAAVKGRMAGAIIGALLGVGCAILAWLTIAVQTGNAALAIIAIVGTLIIGGGGIVSFRVSDVQRKAIGRLNSRAVLTELLPARALAIGITAGGERLSCPRPLKGRRSGRISQTPTGTCSDSGRTERPAGATSILGPKGILWVTYPKGTSKIKADINQDSIREYAESVGLRAVSIFSVDEDWSALRLKIP